jgi:hypothetical protein
MLLILSNDIETNPGPKLVIQSYNVRGLKEYTKLKRILNQANNIKKADPGIFLLHETHINELEATKIDYMWRGCSIVAPGSNSSKGSIMLFCSNQFDEIHYKHGDPNGRSTWLVATKNEITHLFIGVYGPNRNNAEFFNQILTKANSIIHQYNVNTTTIAGDFNIELEKTIGRHASKQEKAATILVKDFMSIHNIKVVSDPHQKTWYNKKSQSTIDYIISNNPGDWTCCTKWGVDRSDHALIEASINSRNDDGPGIPRIDATFLENPTFKEEFTTEVNKLFTESKNEWDPHTKLEFLKVCIRSAAFEAQSKMKKR